MQGVLSLPFCVFSSGINQTCFLFEWDVCVLSHLSYVQPFAILWIVCSPPGSSVHGILQAGILEWAAMPSSRGSAWPRFRTCVSFFSCIGRRVPYHERQGSILLERENSSWIFPWFVNRYFVSLDASMCMLFILFVLFQSFENGECFHYS